MNISFTSEEVEHCRDAGSQCSAIEEAFRRAGFPTCRVIDDAVLFWDQERRLRAFLLPDHIMNSAQMGHVQLPAEPVSFRVGIPIPVSCPDSRLLPRPKNGVARTRVEQAA